MQQHTSVAMQLLDQDLISGNLENINISLDTAFWNGGQQSLGAIGSNFKAAIFSGTNLEAELETTEKELFTGFISNVTGVRPLVDAEANVVLKTRNRLADTPTLSSSVSMDSSGFNPIRQSGRYVRANVKIPGGSVWTHAQGVDYEATQGGTR